jgi:hypothetical protein
MSEPWRSQSPSAAVGVLVVRVHLPEEDGVGDGFGHQPQQQGLLGAFGEGLVFFLDDPDASQEIFY